jgi:hypothetical protein
VGSEMCIRDSPKELPPEINSPLDFLKTKPRKARR